MRVLLVDDHAIVRAGLRRLLATVPGMEVDEAANGDAAMAMLSAFRPDLVVLDLNLPGVGGLALMRTMLRALPRLRVLILTMHSEPFHAQRAIDLGARGFVSKNVKPEELLLAMHRVAAGERYVEAEIAQAIALLTGPSSHPRLHLTEREIEIMRLLAAGHSFQQIADQLGIGYKTVANGCTATKAKLGVRRTADLIRLATQTYL